MLMSTSVSGGAITMVGGSEGGRGGESYFTNTTRSRVLVYHSLKPLPLPVPNTSWDQLYRSWFGTFTNTLVCGN